MPAHLFNLDGLEVVVTLPQETRLVRNGALPREYSWHRKVKRILKEGS